MATLQKFPKFYTIPHLFENACHAQELDIDVTQNLVDGQILFHLKTWYSYSCQVVNEGGDIHYLVSIKKPL